MRLFYSEHFFDPIRRFRDIKLFFGKYFAKSALSQKRWIRSKKSFKKKRRGIKFRVFFIQNTFLIRFAILEVLSFFWKIFSKKRSISKTVHQIKKVLNKKDAELNFAPFLFRTLFWSDSPLWRYYAFFGKYFQKNALSRKRRIG